VCRLNKSLYGLKHAPQAWYHCFASYLVSLVFMEAKSDTSLFVYRSDVDTAYLLLYVDDIILTASSPELLQHITTALQHQFMMKDIVRLYYFLGVSVEQRSDSLFLHQRQNAQDIFEHARMSDCKPYFKPVDTQAKVSSDIGALVSDPTAYYSLAGALQYITFTRPLHARPEPHLTAAKRILRYLQGTLDHNLLLHRASTSDLVVYTDADWAGCPDTCQSTLGYAVFLSDNLVSWSLKHQNIISRSSAETEYNAMANGVAEVCWLRQLLVELHNPLSWATLVYCDNVSAVYLSTNPIQH
jgi:hypothetical protein